MSDLILDSLVKTRTRRKNAGLRLKSLIQAEEIINYTEEDEDVDLLFQEDGTDEEFDIYEEEAEKQKAKALKTYGETSGSDEDDKEEEEPQQEEISSLDELKALQDEGAGFTSDAVYDSDQMFSDSGEENDDDNEYEDEESQLQKQERFDKRKEAKKKRAIPKIKPPSLVSPNVRRNNDSASRLSRQKRKASSLTPSETMENLLNENRRASKRRATVQNKVELVNKLKESEKRRQAIKPKQKKEVHVMTQEEKLLEAIETEKANIESLTRFREQEIIKKEKRSQMLNRKKDILTDIIRFISRVHYVTPEEEMKERAILEEIERKRARRTRKRGPRKQNTVSTSVSENKDSALPEMVDSNKSDSLKKANNNDNNDILDKGISLKVTNLKNAEVTLTPELLRNDENKGNIEKSKNIKNLQSIGKSSDTENSPSLKFAKDNGNFDNVDVSGDAKNGSPVKQKENFEEKGMLDKDTGKSSKIGQDLQNISRDNEINLLEKNDSSIAGVVDDSNNKSEGEFVAQVTIKTEGALNKPETQVDAVKPTTENFEHRPMDKSPSDVNFTNPNFENKQADAINERTEKVDEPILVQTFVSTTEAKPQPTVKREEEDTVEKKHENSLLKKTLDTAANNSGKEKILDVASDLVPDSFEKQDMECAPYHVPKSADVESSLMESKDALQTVTDERFLDRKMDSDDAQGSKYTVSSIIDTEKNDKPLGIGNLSEDALAKESGNEIIINGEPDKQEAVASTNSSQMQQVMIENEESKVLYGPNYKVCRNFITLENFQTHKTISNLTNLKTFMFGAQSNWTAQRKTTNTERIAIIKSEFNATSSLGFSDDDDEDLLTLGMHKDRNRNDIFIPFCESKKSGFDDLFKLPKFGDTSNKVIVNAEDTTLVKEDQREIVIKTEAPSSVYLASGELNNTNNASSDDALRKKCFITGRPALYFEPRTGIPYSSADAYKVIEMIRKGEFTWVQEEKVLPNDESSKDSKESLSLKKKDQVFVGAYVNLLSGEHRAAKGVPSGFLD